MIIIKEVSRSKPSRGAQARAAQYRAQTGTEASTRSNFEKDHDVSRALRRLTGVGIGEEDAKKRILQWASELNIELSKSDMFALKFDGGRI